MIRPAAWVMAGLIGLTVACPASVLVAALAAPLADSWMLPSLVPPAVGTALGAFAAVGLAVLVRLHPWDEDDGLHRDDGEAARREAIAPRREPPGGVF